MATTTSTNTASLTRNPRDSMKSTWRTDKKQWGFHHYLYELLYLHHDTVGVETPTFEKTDKIPVMHNWDLLRWVMVHAAMPLLIHQGYYHVFHKNMHPFTAFIFYTAAYHVIAIRQLHIMRHLGNVYGFLDGDKHPRDNIPDMKVTSVIRSLMATATFRPLLAVIISYRQADLPSSINYTALAIELCLYGVVLDFWFYWYHRIMHQFDATWKFHRTHHLTKHPNPLMSLYADTEQEIIDIAGIPLITYFSLKAIGLPMGFYEWWFCHQVVVFAELLGHSGLRVHGSAPSPLTWLWKMLDMQLVIEDHDLHHRTGWKKSHSYGKQTRVWDRLFGTCAARIESQESNVDRSRSVPVPYL